MSCFRAAMSVIFVTFAGNAVAAPCGNGVDPNGGAIEISGVLHQRKSWGPPNYGENPKTDSKYVAWLVFVSLPIPVQGGADIDGKVQSTVSKIQLNIPMAFDRKSLNLLDGKMVLASGKLWKADTAGYVTPVFLSVKTLTPTDKTICRILPEN